MTSLDKDMEPHLYPKGPVIYYGWSIDGYMKVVVLDTENVSKSQIEEIYNAIDGIAKQKDINDVPVIFIKDGFILEDKNYNDPFNPLVGGIQIAKTGSTASLGFAARDVSTGNKGFVTAKHFASATGLQIYQPTTSGTLIGTVTKVAAVGTVDAAFIDVEDSKVAPKIFLGSGGEAYVRGYNSSTPSQKWVGWRVYKTGKATYVTSGYVTGVGKTVTGNGVQYNGLVETTYSAASGDSGCPVYILDGTCKIVGVHHGRLLDNSKSYFSPVSGIRSALNVLPLTY